MRTTTPGKDPLAASGLEPLLVRASAGTGKTYQLTGRLMSLLAAGEPLESILATTFTRKAAGEIVQRVLATLAAAATDRSGTALQGLSQQMGGRAISRDRALQLVHGLVRDIHRLRILTLDSLFSQLARSFGNELALPPGWRLIDEVEDDVMRQQAVDVMLDALPPASIISLLSMLGKGDTRRSVRNEMLLVVGDGYAEARACRTEAWSGLQVPKAPPPERLAAAAETLRQVRMGHKSADKQLAKLADLAATAAWDELAVQPLVAAAYRQPHDQISYYRKPVPPEAVEALAVVGEACATHVLSLLRAQTEASGMVIAAYEAELMRIKRRRRTLAFDDIAYRLADLFSIVNARGIGHRFDGLIRHVLLDEFQDTAPQQWAILKPLALAAVAPDSHGSFFCVGDTKQAIYGWRGGVAGIFDAVAEEIPGVRQQAQNTSWRASPVITAAVNQIFQNLGQHPTLGGGRKPTDNVDDRSAHEAWAVRCFVDGFPEHDSARPELDGYMTLRSSPGAEGKGDGDDGGGEQGGNRRRGREDQQTRSRRHFGYVARWIADLATEAPGRSVGVLTRTNHAVAWMIHLLRRHGVDVSQEGGNPLTDSPAVDVVLSALMMADSPADRRWWFHVAHSPLAPWLHTGPDDVTYRGHARVRQLVGRLGIAVAVQRLADQLAPVCDQSDTSRLKQLVALAQVQELHRPARLREFVEMVRAKRIEKPRPAQVRVMTVHQAKGLEFDAVVLPQLDSSLVRQSRRLIARRPDPASPPDAMLRYISSQLWHYLPGPWQQTLGDHSASLMTEALCLLYVAITRARQALHIVVPPAEKPDFSTKTAASLLYHSLGCQADPTAGGQLWYEMGERRWMDAAP